MESRRWMAYCDGACREDTGCRGPERCSACGRTVCADDFDGENGLCPECLERYERECREDEESYRPLP